MQSVQMLKTPAKKNNTTTNARQSVSTMIKAEQKFIKPKLYVETATQTQPWRPQLLVNEESEDSISCEEDSEDYTESEEDIYCKSDTLNDASMITEEIASEFVVGKSVVSRDDREPSRVTSATNVDERDLLRAQAGRRNLIKAVAVFGNKNMNQFKSSAGRKMSLSVQPDATARRLSLKSQSGGSANVTSRSKTVKTISKVKSSLAFSKRGTVESKPSKAAENVDKSQGSHKRSKQLKIDRNENSNKDLTELKVEHEGETSECINDKQKVCEIKLNSENIEQEENVNENNEDNADLEDNLVHNKPEENELVNDVTKEGKNEDDPDFLNQEKEIQCQNTNEKEILDPTGEEEYINGKTIEQNVPEINDSNEINGIVEKHDEDSEKLETESKQKEDNLKSDLKSNEVQITYRKPSTSENETTYFPIVSITSTSHDSFDDDKSGGTSSIKEDDNTSPDYSSHWTEDYSSEASEIEPDENFKNRFLTYKQTLLEEDDGIAASSEDDFPSSKEEQVTMIMRNGSISGLRQILTEVICQGNISEFRRRIRKEESILQTADELGWNLLHLAASEGLESFIEELLNNGMHIDSRTKNGYTPLHIALFNKHEGCCRVLLLHGAELYSNDDAFDGKMRRKMRDGTSTPVRRLLDKYEENWRKVQTISHILNQFGDIKKELTPVPRKELLTTLAELTLDDDQDENESS